MRIPSSLLIAVLGSSVFVAGLGGCRGASPLRVLSAARPQAQTIGADSRVARQEACASSSPIAQKTTRAPQSVRTASASQPLSELSVDLFARQSELAQGDYVAEVRRRNPSLQTARSAWFAAAEEYPQLIEFDDQLFQSILAPDLTSNAHPAPNSPTFDSRPKPTRRGIFASRANRARDEAEAAAATTHFLEAELRVARAAQIAYFDYYLVFRELAQNRANLSLMHEFREAAETKSRRWAAARPDPLQAEVELAKLERRQIDLAQRERSATARLNVLVHRRPDLPLPPPVPPRPEGEQLPSAEHLYELSLLRRPELAALAAQMAAESALIEKARENSTGDFDGSSSYDGVEPNLDLALPNEEHSGLPIQKARRRVALREASFQMEKMQADHERRIMHIRQDVQAAHARAEATRQSAQHIAERLLPEAKHRVSAALAAYQANKVDFLQLLNAQRQLVDLQEKQQLALADLQRDLAELERTSGGPLPFVRDVVDEPRAVSD